MPRHDIGASKSLFLSLLPLEVRCLIYNNLFAKAVFVKPCAESVLSHWPFLFLNCVCWTIHEEGWPIFLQHLRIAIGPTYLVQSISPKLLGGVRRLSLDPRSFRGYCSASVHKVLDSMPRLQEVIFSILDRDGGNEYLRVRFGDEEKVIWDESNLTSSASDWLYVDAARFVTRLEFEHDTTPHDFSWLRDIIDMPQGPQDGCRKYKLKIKALVVFCELGVALSIPKYLLAQSEARFYLTISDYTIWNNGVAFDSFFVFAEIDLEDQSVTSRRICDKLTCWECCKYQRRLDLHNQQERCKDPSINAATKSLPFFATTDLSDELSFENFWQITETSTSVGT